MRSVRYAPFADETCLVVGAGLNMFEYVPPNVPPECSAGPMADHGLQSDNIGSGMVVEILVGREQFS